MAMMKTALYNGGKSMHLAEQKLPPIGESDALIAVHGAGICGSDLLINSEPTVANDFPAGHEVAGEIIEVGKGVDKSRIGQRVAVDTIGHGRACMRCWYCRIGQYRSCMDQAPIEGGGFSEYIKRRAEGCYPIPENMSWNEGALVEPLAVSVHGIRRGEMTGNETIVVLGAGTIGLTAVAAARSLGAGKIFISARHEHQAMMAERLGADVVITSGSSDLLESVYASTQGRGADVTIETVGGNSVATLEQAIEVTRVQGRIVVLGGFRKPLTTNWLNPLLKEQSIIFSSCYSVMNGRHDFEISIDLIASGRIQLQQMVTHCFGLDQIQNAFNTAYDKSTGSIKVQIQS